MSYRPSLDYFLETANWPSISRAAKELHITQQSLSIYLKRLEGYYGTTLFERQPYLHLTTEGELLREAALRIDDIYRELDIKLRDKNTPTIVTIGCIRAHTTELLRALPISKFQRKYPNINFEVVDEHSPILEQKLHNREIPFYLGIDGFEPGETQRKLFREFPLYVLVTPILLKKYFGSNWKSLAKEWENGIRLEDIKELPAILLPNHSQISRAANKYAEEHHFKINVTLESFSSEYNLSMVLANVAYTLSSVIPPSDSGVCVFPLIDPPITRRVYCIREKNHILPGYLEDFWKMMINS